MSGFTFQRRVGAAADVLELQYVIALHQTVPRDNAAVSSRDVRSLLASRYGLRSLPPQQAGALVRALGGTTRLAEAAEAAASPSNQSKTKRKWIRSPRDKSKKKRKPRGEGRGWIRRSPRSAAAAGTSEHHQGENKAAPSLKEDAAKDSVEEKGQEVCFGSVSLLQSDVPDHSLESEHVEQGSNGDDAEEPAVNNSEQIMMDDNDENEGEHEEQQEPQEEYLDLVQILSLLLIPYFARSAKEWREGFPDPPVVHRRQGNRCTQPYWNLVHRLLSSSATRLHNLCNGLRPQPDPIHVFDPKRMGLLLHGGGTITTTTSSSSGYDEEAFPLLDEALVEDLLLQHGELERAGDRQLVQEMVQAATTASGRLDAGALVQALALDLGDWKVGSEDHLSTFFEDVFGVTDPHKVEKLEFLEKDSTGRADEEEGGGSNGDESVHFEESNMAVIIRECRGLCCCCINIGNVLLRRCCAVISCCCGGGGPSPFQAERSDVDMVRDSHLSVTTMVGIWLFYITTAITYISLIASISSLEDFCDDKENFGCLCLNKIVTWMVIAVLMSLIGVAFVLPLSYGNNPKGRNPLRQCVAILLALFYAM